VSSSPFDVLLPRTVEWIEELLKADPRDPCREIWIDPRSPEPLMMRFFEQTCSILSISEGRDENPWRSLLFPLARDSPALYHAIAAMAAFHTSKERPSFLLDGLEHHRRSLQSLSTNLSRPDEMNTEAVLGALATTLVLAFTWRWWETSPGLYTATTIGHLISAEFLLRTLGGVARWSVDGDPRVNGVNAALWTFLYNTWYYMDVLARLVGGNYAMRPRESIYFPLPIPQKLDPLMGCATTLFPLIGRVADLCSRVRATPTNSTAIINEATVLKNKIEDWNLGFNFYWEILNAPCDIYRISYALKTAEAYRYATLLYLHQAVPEIYSLGSKQLAKTILNRLAAVPTHSNTVFVQLYPLLVAGCVVDEIEDRQWVRERWLFMAARMWVGNVDRCWKITQEVWSRRDAAKAHKKAEVAAHSDQHSLPNRYIYIYIPQTGQIIEEMDPELTIRGKLHWAGVMRDWGWEMGSIFLAET